MTPAPFLRFVPLLVLFCLTPAVAADSAPETHQQFAERVIKRMRFNDSEKTKRIIAATTAYLEALQPIQEERQATVTRLDQAAGGKDKGDPVAVTAAYDKAKAAYLPLRDAYTKQLEADLVPFLVERVKDALTDDALPKLHAMYLEMIPGLKPAEKAHILGLLVEARENAMTAIGHKAQTQWQHKYRGIINNFIAAQGHDFTTLSKAWDRANPAAEK